MHSVHADDRPPGARPEVQLTRPSGRPFPISRFFFLVPAVWRIRTGDWSEDHRRRPDGRGTREPNGTHMRRAARDATRAHGRMETCMEWKRPGRNGRNAKATGLPKNPLWSCSVLRVALSLRQKWSDSREKRLVLLKSPNRKNWNHRKLCCSFGLIAATNSPHFDQCAHPVSAPKLFAGAP